MARRRTRKSKKKPSNSRNSPRGRIDSWRKSLGIPLRRVAEFRLPHSSVFAAGIAIGLALGLGLGIGIAWLDRQSRNTPEPQVVTEAQPPAETAPLPGASVPPQATPIPPNYVEETEPGADEEPPAVPAQPEPPASPPAVIESNPNPLAANPLPPIADSSPIPAPPATPVPQPPANQQPAAAAAQPNWMQNAVASIDAGGRPMIAIVLDDVGAAPNDVPGAVALPAPITLSIMTYAVGAKRVAKAAHAAGHELLVHVPMEPINRAVDPGPNALLTGLPAAEIKRRLEWGLSQFSGYVGINNHMGSKFTQNAAGMQVVLDVMKADGLIYLDSKTIAGSVGDRMAARMGVSHIKRDVFLDDVIDETDILKQLQRAEAIARKQGYAVAIGHPHPDTVAVLKRWIPQAEAAGFVLVPLSQIVKKREGVTG